MITSLTLSDLRDKYQIPENDIVLQTLNICGIKAAMEHKRVRLRLRVEDSGKEYFLAICVNTRETPFVYKDGYIWFEEKKWGKVLSLKNDTCDQTYLRKGGKHLTLNSNSRSLCKGCRFCGTYSLKEEDISNFNTKEKVVDHIKEVVIGKNGMEDLSNLDSIGVCTGCFVDGQAAVEHIIMLNKVLCEEFGFEGEVQYIGSQIIETKQLDRLKREGIDLALYLTIECFERRKKFLKPVKASISLEDAYEVLEYAMEKEFNTSFLYILGLDSLKSIRKYFEYFKPVITRFPLLNLMQNYVPNHESLRNKKADKIDYYLKARKLLEEIFIDSNFRPRDWENYRSPWYTSFAGEKLIKTPLYESK